jgi:uncharacterized repeat protein (TIGR04042 family)
MRFTVRWPDGSTEQCYSPSLVVKDHLEPGRSYALADFLVRCATALTIASERVEAKYGFPCSRARGQLADLEAVGRRFAGNADARVQVVEFEE